MSFGIFLSLGYLGHSLAGTSAEIFLRKIPVSWFPSRGFVAYRLKGGIFLYS